MPDAPETSAPAGDTADEVPFEVALARLERIVARLEGGDLELEAALAAFEEGVKLSRRCATQIKAAQRRIETLVGQGEDLIAMQHDPREERG